MEPIRSIAEIPFHERDALELLGLAELRDERDGIDKEYDEYGYSRVELLSLHGSDRAEARREPLIIRNALILAMHSADEGEVIDDDIELEFFAEEVEEDYSVTVLLSEFLPKWLPQISADERAIVLVLCNPHRATIARPAALSNTPLYYALGDVEATADYTDGRTLIDLFAGEWRLAE